MSKLSCLFGVHNREMVDETTYGIYATYLDTGNRKQVGTLYTWKYRCKECGKMEVKQQKVSVV